MVDGEPPREPHVDWRLKADINREKALLRRASPQFQTEILRSVISDLAFEIAAITLGASH